MKQITFGNNVMKAPAIVVGCMRISQKTRDEMNHFIHTCLENGANFFDHANIYGAGQSEAIFGEAITGDSSIKREDMIIQTKCGIKSGLCYDSSKEHILEAVDASLKRLRTEYVDVLLIHRPDALVEPEEVAEAFEILEKSGKVRHFGVSNHKPMQIELLKKFVKQDIVANQLQFALPVSNMIANGMEVNMETEGSADRDGSVLDYCRLKDITIQAWSPFQMPAWRGPFIGAPEYPKLNEVLNAIAQKYGVSATTIAAAWILRHPAGMQLITGSASEDRMKEIFKASDIRLTHQEWYDLYLAAGHPLP